MAAMILGMLSRDRKVVLYVSGKSLQILFDYNAAHQFKSVPQNIRLFQSPSRQPTAFSLSMHYLCIIL